jgi:hypothetical protein
MGNAKHLHRILANPNEVPTLEGSVNDGVGIELHLREIDGSIKYTQGVRVHQGLHHNHSLFWIKELPLEAQLSLDGIVIVLQCAPYHHLRLVGTHGCECVTEVDLYLLSIVSGLLDLPLRTVIPCAVLHVGVLYLGEGLLI